MRSSKGAATDKDLTGGGNLASWLYACRKRFNDSARSSMMASPCSMSTEFTSCREASNLLGGLVEGAVRLRITRERRLPAIDLMGVRELFTSCAKTRMSRCHACL